MLLTRRWQGDSSGVPSEEKTHQAPSKKKQKIRHEQQDTEIEAAAAPTESTQDAPAQEEPTKKSVAKPKKKESKKAKRRRHERNMTFKEPAEAAEYLAAWDRQANGEPGWKFNTNTQAWLLRHAYDKDKVPANVFTIFLRYLEGLKGAARARTQTDASAIILLKGAQLKAPEEQAPQKGKKRKGQKKDRSQGAEGGEAEGPSKVGADADEDGPTVDKAEVKLRNLRMKRAQKVLKVLGDPDAEE